MGKPGNPETLKDARGVDIHPGDTVIYGFGVSRSVAMAEGQVEADDYGRIRCTPTGRIWVRVVRRSYGGGEAEHVHLGADRIVVLKQLEYRIPGFYDDPETGYFLPPSPLPTQDQENRDKTITDIERFVDRLQSLLAGDPLPEYMTRHTIAARTLRNPGPANPTEDEVRAEWITWYQRVIPEHRARLNKIETRLPCCEHAGTEGRVDPHCACPCHMTDEELHL